MRVLVVDDEALARRRLRKLLAAHADVEVVGEAVDGVDALAQARALRPDLVLLDIRMPRLDGLAVAAAQGDLPAVVFVSAYPEHAVGAFETAAVDYLLKPVEPERLARALERVRGKLPPRIVALAAGATHVFDARDIARFWAADKYTAFRHGGREHLTEESLNRLEERLAGFGFLRVHRGELIAVARVRTLVDDGSEVILDDGDRARVSRRLLAELRRRLRPSP